MPSTSPRILRRALGALVLSLALLSVLPGRAFGHAAFLESEPAPGTRLQSGPAEIVLEFTEPLNQEFNQATLVNLSSEQPVPITITTNSAEKEIVIQPQERLERAAYRVEWQTVSVVDGHTLAGSFSFGVQTAAVSTDQDLEQSPLARDGWLRIAARIWFYATLFFFAGGVMTATLLSRTREPAGWLVPAALRGQDAAPDPDEIWRRTRDVGWLAVSAAVGLALVEGLDAAGGLSPQGLSDFLLSNAAGLARVGTVIAITAAVLLARRTRYAAANALCLAFLAVALSGHANSADPRPLAVVTDWLHLVAGSVWIGGIAQIAWTWLPGLGRRTAESRRVVMTSVLRPFGRIALPAFVAVVVTGSTNALIQLGGLEALWQTAYGRLLAVKILLVALIALASYWHAMRLRPRLLAASPQPPRRLERRHWRLLSTEPWLGLGVIVAVAALVAFPLPPRQLGEAGEAEAAAPCDPCPLPRAAGEELAVAENAGSNIAAFWLRREGTGLRGTMRLDDLNGKPVDGEVEIPTGPLEECGVGCWDLTLAVAESEISAVVTEADEASEVTVPVRWSPTKDERAERVLEGAERKMRDLRTLRIDESLTSGVNGIVVRSRYWLESPGQMVYRTNTGTDLTVLGSKVFDRSGEGSSEDRRFGSDGFRLDDLFRWSPYGRNVRWLGANKRVLRIALFDRATPIWYRLDIDRNSKRVVSERMITRGHYMSREYFAFNGPLAIRPPR